MATLPREETVEEFLKLFTQPVCKGEVAALMDAFSRKSTGLDDAQHGLLDGFLNDILKDSGVDSSALAKALSMSALAPEEEEIESVDLSARRKEGRKGTSLVMPTQVGNYMREPEIEDASFSDEEEEEAYIPSGCEPANSTLKAKVDLGHTASTQDSESSELRSPENHSEPIRAVSNDEDAVVVLMENYKWSEDEDDVPEEQGVWVDIKEMVHQGAKADQKTSENPFLADVDSGQLPYPSER